MASFRQHPFIRRKELRTFSPSRPSSRCSSNTEPLFVLCNCDAAAAALLPRVAAAEQHLAAAGRL